MDELHSRRIKFVLITMALSIGSDLIATWLVLGWKGATFITIGMNLFVIYHIWKTRDWVFARLYFFGLLVGFGELPSDFMAIEIQKTLVYHPDEPLIWKSPVYMPFSWTVVMVQLGYIAMWLTKKWGLVVATILTGILGMINLPLYEYLAKYADFWYYQNCKMIFGSTPIYVIAGELLITLSLPLIIQQVQKVRVEWIAGWAVLMAVWMWISTVVSYKFFG